MLREKEDTELKPVTTEGDITYIYVMVQIGRNGWCEEWKSVLASSDEAKCKCYNGMEFLNHLVKVFKDYFGVFDEERIRYLECC